MSTISSSTTSTTAYKVTADTTGTLVLQTGATPTTAVTIDGSQNVGIGTSSPTAKLDIQGGSIAVGTTTAGNSTVGMTFGKVAAGGGTISNRITLATYGGSYGAYMEAYADLSASTATYLAFGTQAGGGGTPTERVRIDSSGNVGIGTTSPSTYGKFVTSTATDKDGVNIIFPVAPTGANGPALNFWNNGNTALYKGASVQGICVAGGGGGYSDLTFGTTNNGTHAERARIDYNGNLLVGTTSQARSGTVGVQAVSADQAQYICRNSGATAGLYYQLGVNTANSFIIYNASNAGVYLINGSTSWGQNSDERLKTPLTPFVDAVAKVCTLRTGTGRYLADEEGVSRSFVIAQDVQAVLPEAVSDTPEGMLGVQYTDLIPLLTAAIQELAQASVEQQALITALRTELDAAKADIATLKGAA